MMVVIVEAEKLSSDTIGQCGTVDGWVIESSSWSHTNATADHQLIILING